MSSFRFKVLLFALPLLLPIGRVEITGSAKSDTALTTPATAPTSIEHAIQSEPGRDHDDDR